MYTLARVLSPRQLVAQQLPALAGSIWIAESFYRFGSFSLECLAFLGTWFAIDAILALVGRQLDRAAGGRTTDPQRSR